MMAKAAVAVYEAAVDEDEKPSEANLALAGTMSGYVVQRSHDHHRPGPSQRPLPPDSRCSAIYDSPDEHCVFNRQEFDYRERA